MRRVSPQLPAPWTDVAVRARISIVCGVRVCLIYLCVRCVLKILRVLNSTPFLIMSLTFVSSHFKLQLAILRSFISGERTQRIKQSDPGELLSDLNSLTA